jgi:hypothetical protein
MKMLVAALAATFPLMLPVDFALAANDGMDARTHAKVMRAKRTQAMDAQGREPKRGYQESCDGGVNIGNVHTDRNSRGSAPRENTVVVTGDVIVLPGRNCR